MSVNRCNRLISKKSKSATVDATNGRFRRELDSYHPADEELRKRGYKIHARPTGKPAIWIKDNQLWRQINNGGILLEEV